MKKKTIIHVIDYMGRGGAETMLVQILKQLKEYHNIVVTVNEQNHFGSEIEYDEHYCLKMGSFKNFLFAAYRLNKFIKSKNPHLVHSHLTLSNSIARIGLPKGIPLINSIHSSVTTNSDFKKWYWRLLEKMTYKLHNNIIIGVSKDVIRQYFSFFNFKVYKSYLLYTFVDINKFSISEDGRGANQNAVCKLIAVGGLRFPKNQLYLINAFKKLKDLPFELHIYGTGTQEAELKAIAAEANVNIVFMGEINDIKAIIKDYDIYVMPSISEGFSLSILEAMAMEMPLLISDIPSFKEQCEDVAEYFDLSNEDDFIDKLKALATDKQKQISMGQLAKQRAHKYFTLEHHMQGLRKIYSETLG
jgi:glycosyltransferase involved in cell wall biosynthesis